MAEWLKAHAWKACVRETVPWVRIPLSPPRNIFKQLILLVLSGGYFEYAPHSTPHIFPVMNRFVEAWELAPGTEKILRSGTISGP
jgi:hypothetical protein